MKLAEWIEEKLKTGRLLSEYPLGEFLPFKTNGGKFVKLRNYTPGEYYLYQLNSYTSNGDLTAYIGLDENGLDNGRDTEFAINWDEPINIQGI